MPYMLHTKTNVSVKCLYVECDWKTSPADIHSAIRDAYDHARNCGHRVEVQSITASVIVPSRVQLEDE